MIDKKTFWNESGKAGLVLGSVSIIYVMLNWMLSKADGGVMVSILIGLLWLAKLSISVWLLHFLMQRYHDGLEDPDRRDIHSFGNATAFCSALFYSAFNLAYMLFIAPDTISQAMDLAMESYSSFMDPSQLEMMESMIPKMPALSFFFNLAYCWLFGTVLSSVFSRSICSSYDIFSE